MSDAKLTIRINGEDREIPAPMTVAGLLAHLEIDRRQVGVERNRALVRRDDFDRTELARGDELEIVTFVGGG